MKALLIVPLGTVEDSLLPGLAQALNQAALGFEASIGPAIDEPIAGFHRRRRQYDAASLLEQLWRLYGDAGTAVLGITGLDLFVRGLNFVFGLADRERSLAVVSTARLEPEHYGRVPDARLLENRLLKEAVHELGHILGLDHCRQPGCIMIFSNAIGDTDSKGPGFCSDCREKLSGMAGRNPSTAGNG
jgi:archaemetzincin